MNIQIGDTITFRHKQIIREGEVIEINNKKGTLRVRCRLDFSSSYVAHNDIQIQFMSVIPKLKFDRDNGLEDLYQINFSMINEHLVIGTDKRKGYDQTSTFDTLSRENAIKLRDFLNEHFPS